MEEPLASTMWRYEPSLGKDASPELWRVRTNFAEPKDIMGRFGVWPDDVLTPEKLDALYLGKNAEGCEGFAIPFLDDAEGEAIANVWQPYRSSVLDELRKSKGAASASANGGGVASHGFSSAPSSDLNQGNGLLSSIALSGPALLVFQSLLVYELRSRERETGLWELRTEGQELGTIFAIRPATSATFTRVDVMPLGGESMSILCVPWGGPFGEYCKLLQLLANHYTRRIISSADDTLEVIPEGPTLKMMVGAGLLREQRKSFLDSHWSLAVPVIDGKELGGAMAALSETKPDKTKEGANREGPAGATSALSCLAREISRAVSPGIEKVVHIMRSGRYANADGPGDYVEMAYSVLQGMIFQWAMEEGILRRPATIRATRNGPVLDGVKRGRPNPDPLPGICVLRNITAAWEALNRYRDLS